MAGLAILKHSYDLSDEALCDRWVENPYFQYFCGEEFFQHVLVFDRSSLTRWRQRMGEEKLQALLQESLAVATRTQAMKPSNLARVVIDTTVQPKAVMFPTDAKLLNRARERLVHGVKRRSSSFNTERVDHLIHDPHEKGVPFNLHYGDVTDATNIIRIVQETQPDEIYNLAAQSHVQVSFETPEYTANADGLGTLRLLEAIRILGREGKTRFYQASTSELYGKVREIPQNEATPFYPRSPYAAAKLYAYWITVNYREAYGMYACNGILFNHESPVRGETFVTRKITRALARIKLGLQDCLYLGNLNAMRDWGHARDYVVAQWLMLQQKQAEDFVIASGRQYSVRQFVEAACQELDNSISWRGEGEKEKGHDSSDRAIVA